MEAVGCEPQRATCTRTETPDGYVLACTTEAAPIEPAVCKTTPLTVTVRSWPSTVPGKSVSAYFVASQNIQSAKLSWPLALTVTDTRGCSVTVTR